MCRPYEPRKMCLRSTFNRTLRRIRLTGCPVGPPSKRVDHRHSQTSRCELVDFHSDETGALPGLFVPPSPDRRADSAAQKVVRWVTNYFSPNQGGTRTVHDALSGAVTVTESMPVVLQHVGHSRTVVGYEVQRNGECNLLVFDPARWARSTPLLAQFMMINYQITPAFVTHRCSWTAGRSRHEFACFRRQKDRGQNQRQRVPPDYRDEGSKTERESRRHRSYLSHPEAVPFREWQGRHRRRWRGKSATHDRRRGKGIRPVSLRRNPRGAITGEW